MVHAMTPTPISRSADHRYFYQGKWYPGVTGVLDVLDKSGPLMGWAARQTAEAALAMMTGPDPLYSPLFALLNSVGPEGVVKALTERKNWKRDEAAQVGTDVHTLADMHVRGQDATIPEHLQKHVANYAEWWQASGWTLRISEGTLINPEWGYGGTMDLLAYDRDGLTVLADIKTGAKGVYREAILQLAAYGAATYVQHDAQLFNMPKPDRYAILHVTADKPVREIPVNVGALELAAFGACMDISQWLQTVPKGKL
jgi:hypothetical protein